MKLFLSSKSIMGKLTQPFSQLVNKDLRQIRFCLIENAADPYEDSEKGFMYRTRTDLESLNMPLERLDLRNYIAKTEALKNELSRFDVVWLGGGEPFYLRWILRETGFDKIILDLTENGIVYGGGSAGTIVAGPTLKNFDTPEEPSRAPENIEDGLGLTDLVIIPHWNTPEYQEELEGIKEAFSGTDFKVITLTDEQAVVVNGSSSEVTPKE